MEELNQHIESDEISLKEIILKSKVIWHFLLKKWIIIVVACFIGASIGLTKAWLTKPQYTAKLTFSVENEKGNPLGAYSGLASMAGIDLGGSAGSMFSSDNIMSIMTSRKMIVNTLLSTITINNKRITQIEFWLQFNHFNEKWSKTPKLSELKFPTNLNPDSLSRLQDSVLTNVYVFLIKTAININKPDKKLSLIESKCTSENEIFSKLFLENLNTKVTDFYIGIKTKRLKENVDILQNKADSLYKVISYSMYSSATISDQNLNLSKQLAGVDRQRKQIDLQVSSTAYTEIIKNLEMAKITLKKETPLIQVIDHPVFPLQKEKESRLIGLLLGGFLAGFLIVGFLLIQKWYQKMLKSEG